MTGRTPLYVGLACTMLATLALEIVDSRLLSVVTWYHVSFVAISVAMLGAAAGGVAVFTAPDRFPQARALDELASWSTRFAVSIPLSHVVSLSIPMPSGERWAAMDVVELAVAIAVIAAPFALSGFVTTLALTRTTAPVGRLYAADLTGAAAGCLAAVVVLDHTNLSSAAFFASAIACVGAACFRRAAGRPLGGALPVIGAAVTLIALLNTAGEPLRVVYPKNRNASAAPAAQSLWNSHAHLLVTAHWTGPAFYWGGGVGSGRFQNTQAFLFVDGEAGTPMTAWDGSAASLMWVSHDVTSLAYHLRSGSAAIVGVGGGRDILAAIWSRSPSITGVEVNANILALLERDYRVFTKIADHPGVRLVHDEGRSYLTRTSDRFDVLQMSLVDTWAATGAGAFTLSENGLYTREAWGIFLDRLKPTGLLSVSRWFSPVRASETSRLVALGTSALLDRGIRDPARHLALVSRHNVATLLVSPSPLSDRDLDTLDAVSAAQGFTVLLSPHVSSADARLGAIARSRSARELETAVRDDALDYRPPTDARPFFFNMLKPGAWWRGAVVTDGVGIGGVVNGNLRATSTLAAILGVSIAFVLGTIAVPLLARGRPAVPTPRLAAGLAYFSCIGVAFMFVQVAYLQRFSVLLGHPTYALVVVLFSMILFAGLGSLLSERIVGPVGARFAWLVWLLAAALLATGLSIGALCGWAVAFSSTARIAIVVFVMAPVSVLLGICFPHGARLVQRRDADALAWMWGANGGAGVLASIVAVIVSMTFGIEVNLLLAAALYGGLPWLARGIDAG